MRGMIGSLPKWALAAREYGHALDAAMTLLAGRGLPLTRCAVPTLNAEIDQRLPHRAERGCASAALWVEPLSDNWQAELDDIASALAVGGRLVLVASRPLAHLLPGQWMGCEPLGRRFGGLLRFRNAMRARGLSVEAEYGLHSVPAIFLNMLAGSVTRWGRPDLGDRLHFASRLYYCTAGPLAPLSIVALLVACRKGRDVPDGDAEGYCF